MDNISENGMSSSSTSQPHVTETQPSNIRDESREVETANEASPLLNPRTSEDTDLLPPPESVLSPSESGDDWIFEEDFHESQRQETKGSLYLFLLTLSVGGLQIAWSVETSSFSPYLLSLGVSKSLLALIWIAGPLSGVLVQPYVGLKSDQCRSRFGKRRPFMVGGAIATSISLLILAWTKEIVTAVFNGILGAASDSPGVKFATITVAIIAVCAVDFAINVIQAAIRAFIVDNAPTHQQDSANAWASRLSGAGNILGYLVGSDNLPKYLWFLGKTQFQVLCVIASFAMLVTVAIGCWSIPERDARLDESPSAQKNGVLQFFKDLYRSVHNLPRQIKAVCAVQFFAWIGWFPFLFYTTTYIGEIYVQPIFSTRPNMTGDEIDAVWQRATIAGTLALFVFAIASFVASVVLPFMVASPLKASERSTRTRVTDSPTSPASTNRVSRLLKPTFLDRVLNLSNRLPSVEIEWLTLRRAWLLSHVLFAVLMWLTLVVKTTTAATILVSLVGIPWAITIWVPFALIATEISKRDASRRGYVAHSAAQNGELLPSARNRKDRVDPGTDQAGVVLGIHNVAVSAPQIIATLVSSAIFRALQKPRGSVGDESVAWVLRFGGLAALAAAWTCRQVGEERDE